MPYNNIKYIDAFRQMRSFIWSAPEIAKQINRYGSGKDHNPKSYADMAKAFKYQYSIQPSNISRLNPELNAVAYLSSVQEGSHKYHDQNLTKPDVTVLCRAIKRYETFISRHNPHAIDAYIMINYYKKLCQYDPAWLDPLPDTIPSAII